MAGTSVTAVRAALLAALQGLYAAPTLVIYGPSGADLPDEIVGLRGSRVPAVTKPTSATTRPREEVTETEVIYSIWTADATGSDDQRIYERAFTLAAQLADYLRTGNNITLGGACYDAFVSSYDDGGGVVATYADDPDDDQGRPIITGRVIELVTVVTTKARV